MSFIQRYRQSRGPIWFPLSFCPDTCAQTDVCQTNVPLIEDPRIDVFICRCPPAWGIQMFSHGDSPNRCFLRYFPDEWASIHMSYFPAAQPPDVLQCKCSSYRWSQVFLSFELNSMQMVLIQDYLLHLTGMLLNRNLPRNVLHSVPSLHRCVPVKYILIWVCFHTTGSHTGVL